MRFELFESDGSRWLCKNVYARTQIMMYEHVGKKNNLFSTLWYRGAILLAGMLGVAVVAVRNIVDMRM
jgi:hypothetical protein